MENKEENQKVVEALRQLIPPQAILFDLDGVLVDISASYTLATKKTAEYFLGVEVSLSEIQEYKNRGGYNNDWDLTEAIIMSRGKRVEKGKIIKRFQIYYLGSDFDGLVENETWLLEPDVLNELKKDYKLGIVTGRPRKEAEYVLHRFNSRKFFDVLIAMEDTPEGKGKPDPCGIKMAMEKLGIKHAVYLGDNIDDIKAAIAAGVDPIGVTNESDSEEQKRLLKQYGAKHVLGSVNEVLEVLK